MDEYQRQLLEAQIEPVEVNPEGNTQIIPQQQTPQRVAFDSSINRLDQASNLGDSVVHQQMQEQKDPAASFAWMQFFPRLQGIYQNRIAQLQNQQSAQQAALKAKQEQENWNKEFGLKESAENRAVIEFMQKQQEATPNEFNTELFRGLAKQMAPSLGHVIDKMNDQQLKSSFPSLQGVYNAVNSRLEAQARLADADAARQQNRMISDRQFQISQDEKQAKKQNAVVEVEEKLRTLTDNADAVINMIKEKGTYEAIGPHNEVMRRLVDTMANDMSKLTDPASKVTASEVETWRKNLVDPTSPVTNATAIENLEQFKKEVLRRRDTAYKVRGLTPPTNSDSASGDWTSAEVIKKQYSPSTNKTKLIYSDGTEKIIDGKQ